MQLSDIRTMNNLLPPLITNQKDWILEWMGPEPLLGVPFFVYV